MIVDESNIDAIVADLEAWIDSFNFLRVGKDETLGRDVAMTFVDGVIGRNE